ncbi:MAG: hypothetical protein HYU39_06005 [Thaumarchaeota archaeon]|nr:hypothetical protein [Nitrososphaerota archaeon]
MLKKTTQYGVIYGKEIIGESSKTRLMGYSDELRPMIGRLSSCLVVCGLSLLSIHWMIIAVSPFIYFSLTLSMWLVWELWLATGDLRRRMALYSTVFLVVTLRAFTLILQKPAGIFFDLEPLLNMVHMAYAVFLVSLLLMAHDLMRHLRLKEAGLRFVAFSSSVLWIAPFVAEITVVAQWLIEGTIATKTKDMALGGAGLSDVLWDYGFRSFLVSGCIVIAIWLLMRYRRVRRKTDLGLPKPE